VKSYTRISFFFLPRCSHTWELAPASEHRAEFPQFLNQGQSVGLLGRVVSSSQGLYLYTNTKHPCPEWDSNPGPGFRASEDSARLRPLGYRDRRISLSITKLRRTGEWSLSPKFLTSSLDVCERSISRSCRFTPVNRTPGIHCIGVLEGPQNWSSRLCQYPDYIVPTIE
jgi:hypothetical protein